MNIRLTKCGTIELIDGRATIPSTRIGLLSNPSKMPCYSFSLPAISSCPGAWFGPGGICGLTKALRSCYATSGRYTFDLTLNAQAARYAWTLAMMRERSTAREWSTYMALAIEHASRSAIRRDGRAFFRIHDSGDMFNLQYIDAWRQVIAWLPDVQFWLPTRSWRLANLLPGLQDLAMLPNVAVKPSALRFGDRPPIVAGLDAGTSASGRWASLPTLGQPADVGANCPAPRQGGECRDCRHCWRKNGETTYLAHGVDVHHVQEIKHRPPVSIGQRDERLATFQAHWKAHFNAVLG